MCTQIFRLQRGLKLAARCRLVRSQTLRQHLRKCAVKVLSRKIWEMGVLVSSLSPAPREESHGECSQSHLTTASLFAIVPWDS